MKSIKNILCIIDHPDQAAEVVEQAKLLAKGQQAVLCIAAVLDKPEFALPIFDSKLSLESTLQKIREQKLSELTDICERHCAGTQVETKLLEGIPFIAITHEVLSNQRDFVVRACVDAEHMNRIISKDNMQLLRNCPAPVLLLKPQVSGSLKNILATIDVLESDSTQDEEAHVQSKLNERVMKYSVEVALAEGASLHVGSVWDAIGEQFLRHSAFSNMSGKRVDSYVEQTQVECEQRLQTFLSKMQAAIGDDAFEYLQPHTHLVKGLPEKEIPLIASENKIDLIVMGTVARTGIPGFIIGNTAESILEHVNCSVLAIKPEGFKSPVAQG